MLIRNILPIWDKTPIMVELPASGLEFPSGPPQASLGRVYLCFPRRPLLILLSEKCPPGLGETNGINPFHNKSPAGLEPWAIEYRIPEIMVLTLTIHQFPIIAFKKLQTLCTNRKLRFIKNVPQLEHMTNISRLRKI